MSVVWLGYLASAVIALSLTMTSIVRLRLINLCGACLFATYGLLIGAYPVVLLNSLTMTLNVIFLTRLFRNKAKFCLLPMSTHSPYLQYFLQHYEEDIRQYFPVFRSTEVDGLTGYYVLRDLQIAGVLLGRVEDEKDFHILLDYVPPAYRDYKAGHFLFEESVAIFREMGVYRLLAEARSDAHARYLQKMGFTRVAEVDGELRFERKLKEGLAS
ncbi:MAG: YgjV family protein [Myxococcales bacterium]|nr:YgjV family protein [Myxococcales bacterium]MCB9641582.1 YgjV family protein [Myxococcales bacterium]